MMPRCALRILVGAVACFALTGCILFRNDIRTVSDNVAYEGGTRVGDEFRLKVDAFLCQPGERIKPSDRDAR